MRINTTRRHFAEKVGAGTFGLAVDWEVASFDQAFKHLTDLGATIYRGP